VKHRLEYLLVRAIGALVSVVPMPVVRSIGAAVGRFVYVVDAPHRRTALENLAAAFPGRPASEHRALTRAMFAHFGSLLLELLKFGSYTPEQMLAAVDIEGEDRVRQAQQAGKGILFFTGHFGYWEIQAIVHALRGYPTSVLARPLDNPQLHQWLERIRTRTGGSVIYRQGAVRKMLRELASNHGIAVLIDQHLQSDAIYVDFFQRPAATTSALAALALRTGAAVIPVFALPLPGGRYRLIYEHPVDPPRADDPDPIHSFTQRCTDVLEMYVRRNPERWLWMHRRWRDEKWGRESFPEDGVTGE
jgi:Kdo2-lipid IVA lauroyltransferase/acyltransferase